MLLCRTGILLLTLPSAEAQRLRKAQATQEAEQPHHQHHDGHRAHHHHLSLEREMMHEDKRKRQAEVPQGIGVLMLLAGCTSECLCHVYPCCPPCMLSADIEHPDHNHKMTLREYLATQAEAAAATAGTSMVRRAE